jgi:hypothetical protein
VKADLRYGRIGFSVIGVLNEGITGVRGMTIGASEVGVYARAGFTSVVQNRIYGVKFAAIFADPGAKVWAQGNWVYPGPDCGFLGDQAYNATGQACRPWSELPDALGSAPPYAGQFQDGWSEWNYDWGYDWRVDPWRTGPGRLDDGPPGGDPPPVDGGGPPPPVGGPGAGPVGGPGGGPIGGPIGGPPPGLVPDFRDDYGYRTTATPPLTPRRYGTYPAPQSPGVSIDPYKQ